MISTLKSVFVICHDLEACAAFYRRLGLEEREPGRRSRRFGLGEQAELHLHEPLTSEEQARYGMGGPGTDHSWVLSFSCDDLEGLYRRLQEEAPQALLTEPHHTPWGTRMLMVSDPEGRRLEFQEAPAHAP